MARDVYIVTHPEATHHVERRVGGWYDTPLTDLGRRQAATIAARLAASVQGVRILSSDLKRARETADAVAGRLGAEVETTPDLREMSYGIGESRAQAWFEQHYDAGHGLDHRGIEKGETRRELATRVSRAMGWVVDEDIAVVVTHGFAMTFCVAAWIGMPLEACGRINLHSTPGGITHLHEDDRFGNRAVLALDLTSHLAGA
jgi:probable phosphoglycerate mutase